MNETIKNLKNIALTTAGTVAVTGTIAATPAKAQTGGSQAPAPVETQAGGTPAPAEASQTLEDQAEQAEATVANKVITLENGNDTSPAKSVPNVAGDALSETTVTLPAKDKQGHVDGQYKFEIKTDDQGANGPLQPGSVVSVMATETATGASVPEASVIIDQNPGTNTAEIGGTYQMSGNGSASTKNPSFKSFSAEVQAVSPTAPIANSYEVNATKDQLLGLAESAKVESPFHQVAPAVNTTTGATINGPRN